MSREAVLEVLGRLWQTKQSSINLMEKWLTKTADFEIKTGLKSQVTDERRHLRLLGEQIVRLGGSLKAAAHEQFLGRPMAIVLAQPNDLYRLSAFHRGVKGFTAVRCGHLIPMVDAQLARVLEQITREDERHIRWAEIRLSRALDLTEVRQCRFIVERIQAAMEIIWSRPWRRLTQVRLRIIR
jgi:hypothetical protein